MCSLQGRRLLLGAIACNAFVFIMGVLVASIVNRALFLKNGQDLSHRDTFGAAFEQPFLTLCVLTCVVSLEGSLVWLLRQRPAPDAPQHGAYHADLEE
jgi:hypothetical protein